MCQKCFPVVRDISSALLGILETSFKGLSTRKDLNILMSSMLDSMNSVIDLEIGKPLSPMRIPSQFKIVFCLTYILYTFRSIKCTLEMFLFFLDFVSIFKYFFFFSTKLYTHINKTYAYKTNKTLYLPCYNYKKVHNVPYITKI